MSLISKLKAWWTGKPENIEVIPKSTKVKLKNWRPVGGFRDLKPKKKNHTVEFAITYEGKAINVAQVNIPGYSNNHVANLAQEHLKVKVMSVVEASK
jgi:hypothetical protein